MKKVQTCKMNSHNKQCKFVKKQSQTQAKNKNPQYLSHKHCFEKDESQTCKKCETTPKPNLPTKTKEQGLLNDF